MNMKKRIKALKKHKFKEKRIKNTSNKLKKKEKINFAAEIYVRDG